MYWLGDVNFMVQILIAELLFLYPAEKRRWFVVRYLISIAICVALSILFSRNNLSENLLLQFFHFINMFIIATAAMGFCFKLQISALISSCTAGYAVQHIATHIMEIARHYGLLADVRMISTSNILLNQTLPVLVVYLVFWLTIGLYSARHQCYKKADMRFNFLSITIIFICVGLTRVSRYFGDAGSVTVSLYAIVSLLMALIVQLILSKTAELQDNNEVMHLLWQKERQQYERSKIAIDTINIKYHDLKHRLRDFHLPQEEIDAIKEAVRIYGSQVKTGNEALDVLLTENALRLSEEGITLTYMGNGGDFCFMDTMDVYSLFGNAVDNAVDAVRRLDDPEKRIINIVVERKGNLINIDISNYFSGKLTFADGLPVTTAQAEKELHGFGMKSMRLIAQKYGGDLTVTANGDVFDLGIYLMQE